MPRRRGERPLQVHGLTVQGIARAINVRHGLADKLLGVLVGLTHALSQGKRAREEAKEGGAGFLHCVKADSLWAVIGAARSDQQRGTRVHRAAHYCRLTVQGVVR